MAVGIEYVPVRSAATMLRVSVQRVHQLIGRDRLIARRIDRTWLVSMRSIKQRLLEMEERKHGGRSDR